MKFPDSNFLFGYFVENDALHAASKRIALTLKTSQCVVLSDILHEVVSIAAVRHGSKLAVEIGEWIFDNFVIYTPKKKERAEIWQLFKKLGAHRFSYADVALYYFGRQSGNEVVTFDKALAKLLSA